MNSKRILKIQFIFADQCHTANLNQFTVQSSRCSIQVIKIYFRHTVRHRVATLAGMAGKAGKAGKEYHFQANF